MCVWCIFPAQSFLLWCYSVFLHQNKTCAPASQPWYTESLSHCLCSGRMRESSKPSIAEGPLNATGSAPPFSASQTNKLAFVSMPKGPGLQREQLGKAQEGNSSCSASLKGRDNSRAETFLGRGWDSGNCSCEILERETGQGRRGRDCSWPVALGKEASTEKIKFIPVQ